MYQQPNYGQPYGQPGVECPNCHAAVSPSATFCNYCGANVPTMRQQKSRSFSTAMTGILIAIVSVVVAGAIFLGLMFSNYITSGAWRSDVDWYGNPRSGSSTYNLDDPDEWGNRSGQNYRDPDEVMYGIGDAAVINSMGFTVLEVGDGSDYGLNTLSGSYRVVRIRVTNATDYDRVIYHEDFVLANDSGSMRRASDDSVTLKDRHGEILYVYGQDEIDAWETEDIYLVFKLANNEYFNMVYFDSFDYAYNPQLIFKID